MSVSINIIKMIKKIFIVGIACTFVLLLVGCSDGKPKDVEIDTSKVEQRVNGEMHAKSYMRNRRAFR